MIISTSESDSIFSLLSSWVAITTRSSREVVLVVATTGAEDGDGDEIGVEASPGGNFLLGERGAAEAALPLERRLRGVLGILTAALTCYS